MKEGLCTLLFIPLMQGENNCARKRTAISFTIMIYQEIIHHTIGFTPTNGTAEGFFDTNNEISSLVVHMNLTLPSHNGVTGFK